MSNTLRTIVIFEARPRWEPELQRQFLGEPVRVRGCRTWSELSSLAFLLTAVDPANPNPARSSVPDAIVIELPDDATAYLQWLASVTTRARVPSLIVLCEIGRAHV